MQSQALLFVGMLGQFSLKMAIVFNAERKKKKLHAMLKSLLFLLDRKEGGVENIDSEQ